MARNNQTGDGYIPGVCNIGPEERKARRRSGIIGLAITIILLAVLVGLHAPKIWRLLLFFPAALAATGFLQDWLHFCAGFGLKGIYNVARSVGDTEDVTNQEYRRKDKRKALIIFYSSCAIGLIVAVAAYLL